MEGFGASSLMKKRRSATSRRPRSVPQLAVEGRDVSPPTSTPSSDNADKLSPDESAGHCSFQWKDSNFNSSARKVASINKIENPAASEKFKRDDTKIRHPDKFDRIGGSRAGLSGNTDRGRGGVQFNRCSKGVLGPANWRSSSKAKDNFEQQSTSPDDYVGKTDDCHNFIGQLVGAPDGSAENKPRKVKLKVGGITRTIHAKSNSENGKGVSSLAKSSRSSDVSRHRPKLILEDTSDDDIPPPGKGDGLQEPLQNDFQKGSFSYGAKENSRTEVAEENLSTKHVDKPRSILSSEPVRKSKRVPKRRLLDGAFEANEDEEIRYLERLKASRASSDYTGEYVDEGEGSVKKKKISKVSKTRKSAYDVDEHNGLSQSNKESRRKTRTERESIDTDFVEEEELGSDDGSDAKRKKPKKETTDSSTDVRSEPLTTRRRALQSGKGAGENLFEFPNGLPPPAPRRQKEKLSEVEQQARKAEAAQRRRMQVEKAARESEAEAIRKILGQDSTRKKREEKIRKERDEMAKKRAAEALILSPNTVRWVMGPTGTVVTFADDLGLPSIFNTKQSSYPPPREKCAGPSCTNAYRYRDSKSNLPLCSLECYRAVQENAQPVSTC